MERPSHFLLHGHIDSIRVHHHARAFHKRRVGIWTGGCEMRKHLGKSYNYIGCLGQCILLPQAYTRPGPERQEGGLDLGEICPSFWTKNVSILAKLWKPVHGLDLERDDCGFFNENRQLPVETTSTREDGVSYRPSSILRNGRVHAECFIHDVSQIDTSGQILE